MRLVTRGIPLWIFALGLVLGGARYEDDSVTSSASATEVWDFAGQTYPVIYAGDEITAPVGIESIAKFLPCHGSDRAIVNPALPAVRSNRILTFVTAGEYFLVLNGTIDLKVLVLDPDEPVSESVARVFNFCCANMIAANMEDAEARRGCPGYTRAWFLRKNPAVLTCGPTKDVFQLLIADRFGLPFRHVTFPGVAYSQGEIIAQTHNVAEVYLPDLRKWVVFDVNNGFLPCWQSALDVARRVHALGIERRFENDEWDSLGFAIHPGVPKVHMPKTQSPDEGTPIESLNGERLIYDVRGRQLSILFLGGPAYWGRPGRGTEFLDHPYNLGWQHQNTEFRQRIIEWIGEFDFDVAFYDIDELQRILDDGHRSTIEAQAWRSRISEQQRIALEAADR